MSHVSDCEGLRRQMCYFQESRVRSQETLRLLIRQRDSEQDVWELLQRDRLLLLQSHSWLGRTPTWSRFRESPSLIGEETSSDDSPSRGTSRATGYALRFGLLWPLLVCREISQVPHCTMVPLSTRICLKSNKLRPILNGQFWHAISKNICLNVFGSKQPWEILVFVIFKL